MNTPRWFPCVALVAILPLLFGCAAASGSSSQSSGNGSGSAAGFAITTNSLPDATVDQSYSDTLQASGGTTPYTWIANSSQLPAGMSVSTSGQLSGTPTQQGSYSFQVQVTDAASNSTSTNLSIKVTGPAPVISSITPNTGSVSGGTPVTISGNKLQSGATVTFGGVPGTSANVTSSTQMTAVTPAHAAGSVDVTVTNPGGKFATLAGGFGYQNAAPTLSSVSPTSGPTSGGTAVNITGANFVLGAVVLFGSLQATSVTVTTATQIQAVSPAESAGSVDVVVKNPDGQTATLSGAFSYTSAATAAPSISALSPNSGPDGTQTLINGSDFASGATVSFGGTQASSVQFVNTSQLSVVVPSLSTGTVDVTVNDPGGATATLASGFTVITPQSLLSGCTVGTNNVPSCSTPSGWSLVTADGFESGSINSPLENLGYGTNKVVSTANPHTGKYSLQCNIANDGDACEIDLNNGADGTFSDIYVSYWRYMAPSARGDLEIFFDRLWSPQSSSGTSSQSIVMDTQNYGDSYGVTSMTAQNISTGSYTWADPNGTGNWNLPLGTWEQVEVWQHPNTCTAGTPNKDGFYRLYVNGNLISSDSNIQLNGCVSMSNGWLEIGGVYTFMYFQNNNQCVDRQNHPSTSVQVSCNLGSTCPPYQSDGATPCINYGPYNVYLDDLVVMKK